VDEDQAPFDRRERPLSPVRRRDPLRSPLALTGIGAALIAIGAGIGVLTLGSAPKPASADASASPSAIAMTLPSASLDAKIANSSAPPAKAVPTLKPSPKPTSKPPAIWSKPVMIGAPDGCTSVVAAIDDSGTNHLATTCDGAIRYATSAPGRPWSAENLVPPIGRLEKDPQITFDENKLYLAYSRLAVMDGGCGDDGLDDLGVYYRVRTLPDGAWSEAKRIGLANDHIQSLRVKGTIHATVLNDKDGNTYYETLAGSTYRRYPITDAAGLTSLRIGSDGRARIAYENASGSIAYGLFKGSSFTTAAVPGTAGGWAPVLALGNGNAAYLLWNRSYHGRGCTEPGPDPADGTYFGTNVTGRWASSRLTKSIGGASFALDLGTGDVHVLVPDQRRLAYFVKSSHRDWRTAIIVRDGVASSVIRANPDTGALLVGYVSEGGEGSSGALYAMTKG
jgi:hypothetical protein